MSEEQNDRFEVDLWENGEEARPPCRGEVRLACVHEVDFGIDSVAEQLYFRRLEHETELWRMHDCFEQDDFEEVNADGPEDDRPSESCWEGWRVVVDHRPPKDDFEACRQLLKVRVKAGVGYGWPNSFHVNGILSASDHKEVLDEIASEIEAIREQAARYRSSPIIRVATDLGLSPEPTSWHPDSWWCRCPGTSHRLAIVASTGEFGCGYCGVKGGIDELKAFVERRRKAQA